MHPRLTQGAFYVPELERHFFREYTDTLSIAPKMKQPTGMNIMQKDEEGHAVEMEYGLSFFKDSQRLTLQEMPEVTPTGQLPRSVEIVCENDLVDATKPGDRVRVWGVLRTIPSREMSILSGFARSFLVCINIELLNMEKRVPQLTPANIRSLKVGTITTSM